MKNYQHHWILCLSALLMLTCSFGAQATAPRITAQLFGEERKTDIVAYQSADTKSDTALAVQIVNEAFRAAGKTPVVDVLPSRQLASYALFNHDAEGLIGSPEDLAAKDKKRYRTVIFYLSAANDEPVALIFNAAHGKELHKAFTDGMQQIINNGKYLQIIKKTRGKLPADYLTRLKRNGWK